MAKFSDLTQISVLLDKLIELPDLNEEIEEINFPLMCWLLLYNNPGSNFTEWAGRLLSYYGAFIKNNYGTDPIEVFEALCHIWGKETFKEKSSGIECTYKEWSEYFSTEKSKELYDIILHGNDDKYNGRNLSDGFQN